MKSTSQHLVWLLQGGNAHIGFEDVIADFPIDLRGKRAPGNPHTAWRLLEHLRIAQWDILEFSRSAQHVSPEFPDGYWPEHDAPPSAAAWAQSVAAFQRDLGEFVELLEHPESDLLAAFSWGDGQTLLREALLLADHNAYHLGQMVSLRRALGAWS